MKFNVLLTCLLLVAQFTQGQIRAKAISYVVEADIRVFAPEEAAEMQQPVCKYEVDAYFTDSKLKTMVRNIYIPSGFTLSIRQRIYDTGSKDERNIDHENEYMLLKKDQDFKITSTGKTKTILGYTCKEYTFKDYRNITFNVWVTDKLPKNICPAGNFSLKGTALELKASNGITYVATDIAEGELDVAFFDLPNGYEEEVVNPPAKEKKTK